MRHEPTFLHTAVHHGAEDPGLFVLYETWRDRDDFFAVQRNRLYRAAHEARLPSLLRAPRSMVVLKTLRSDTGQHVQADGQKSDPLQVLQRFYAAEHAYMNAGGAAGGASFDAIAGTLDPEVVLHQSPDLPCGGEFHGHQGYAAWAQAMSTAFDQLEVADQQSFVHEDTVVTTCRLIARSRATGKSLDLPMAQVVRVRGDRILEFRPFYWNVPAYHAVRQP